MYEFDQLCTYLFLIIRTITQAQLIPKILRFKREIGTSIFAVINEWSYSKVKGLIEQMKSCRELNLVVNSFDIFYYIPFHATYFTIRTLFFLHQTVHCVHEKTMVLLSCRLTLYNDT